MFAIFAVAPSMLLAIQPPPLTESDHAILHLSIPLEEGQQSSMCEMD